MPSAALEAFAPLSHGAGPASLWHAADREGAPGKRRGAQASGRDDAPPSFGTLVPEAGLDWMNCEETT